MVKVPFLFTSWITKIKKKTHSRFLAVLHIIDDISSFSRWTTHTLTGHMKSLTCHPAALKT